MLSACRWLKGSQRIDQTRFQARMLFRVEALSLPAIRLILIDRSEIGFLSHRKVEFVPLRSQNEKASSLARSLAAVCSETHRHEEFVIFYSSFRSR
jgi:hypothetical protein